VGDFHLLFFASFLVHSVPGPFDPKQRTSSGFVEKS
jgi:hypothetical protein